MRMSRLAVMFLALLFVRLSFAADPPATQPSQLVRKSMDRILSLIEPDMSAPAQALTARLVLVRSEGLPSWTRDLAVDLAFQAPDRLLLVAHVDKQTYSAARDGQDIWIHEPPLKFGVLGQPGVPRFAGDDSSIDNTLLAPFRVPLTIKTQLLMLPLLSQAELRPQEVLDNQPCHVVRLSIPQALLELLGLPAAELELAIRQIDDLPARIRFTDGRKINAELALRQISLQPPLPADHWKIKPNPGDHIERVAVSHLTKFMTVAIDLQSARIPTLGPARGQRVLVGQTGEGRLELWDDTRVLFLKGTPPAMGRQQGTLLKKEIHLVVDRILYGVGVGSSFGKGRWFFGEIEEAQRRLAPFVSDRYWAEMDALADAAGIDRREIRLANLFPELFHCTGFAIFGDATQNGRMYHGRVLDYLRGMGLEQNAVVVVYQPDEGNAWVNIGYTGFIGSVSGMNAKRISIGEMGGRGEGNWDGKPMAQLMREVMEKADTLEAAIDIFRKGPRTCEYYYVICDGNSRTAVGLETTPDKFVTVFPGESHPLLPRPVKDALLVSAGSRYNALVDRVQSGYGRFDMLSARALMDPPVCMNSNIHSVLFAPETLDLWVANADSKNVASKTRYTHYNLGQMLKAPPAPPAEKAPIQKLWEGLTN